MGNEVDELAADPAGPEQQACRTTALHDPKFTANRCRAILQNLATFKMHRLRIAGLLSISTVHPVLGWQRYNREGATMKRTSSWVVGIVVLLLSSSSVLAQELATLKVTVNDQTGAVIPGTTIALKNSQTGVSR